MAALGASDWTVSVLSDRIHQKARHIRASLSLPTTGTYPSNGVPIPAYTAFGFKRNLESIQIYSEGANFGNKFKYDPVNGSIRIYVATTGNELATTANGAGNGSAEVLYVTAIGW